MRLKTAIYLMGIPLAALWLFVQITGFVSILYVLIIIGVVVTTALVFSVVKSSSTTPYQQYVIQHNQQAAMLRAKKEEDERLAHLAKEKALIDESDD